MTTFPTIEAIKAKYANMTNEQWAAIYDEAPEGGNALTDVRQLLNEMHDMEEMIDSLKATVEGANEEIANLNAEFGLEIPF